ncbi:MAG: formate dehydrogenase [Geobacteraceae bacterium GWC2_55_20]|nr:MAG: formate dehydrogenase [Geobacteraceae bacterium GWC2_55_20]OGU26456.1 MAG: formate dehydrogenase [Geobacteraceae bacterium GWF2_54_21]HCE66417.1 formate dehydrogenase accessory protein FdhE [Geobacter sp.]
MTTTEIKIAALRQAAASSPEYAAITPLFVALFDYISGRELQSGITIDLSGINRLERSAHGFPLVSPAELSLDRELLTSFLAGVVRVLEQQGSEGDEELGRIAGALSAGEIDPQSLLVAILERRRAPLEEASAKLGVPAPLLEYIFEIPLKTALEQCAAAIPADAFPDWHESVCPVCGSRPGMAELAGEEGRRQLCCSACFYSWQFKRLKCPSCGCEDTEQLSYFTAGEGATRVDTCRACSRYIKTRDKRRGGGDVPLEVEDLLTIHLDLLASREGFERGK